VKGTKLAGGGSQGTAATFQKGEMSKEEDAKVHMTSMGVKANLGREADLSPGVRGPLAPSSFIAGGGRLRDYC